MAWQILMRILLLIVAIFIGFFFFPVSIYEFVTEILKYQRSQGFFGFAVDDWFISYSLAQALWAGIIFGTLGKKIDYIFIAVFFVLMSLNHLYTENMTWLVYSGFVGASALGIAIGFILNRLWHRFSPKK